MGWFALVIALLAGLAAVLPNPGMFLGMGLGILAIGTGLVGYRRRAAAGSARLAGAGAITVGAVALLLSLGRYALTLAAVSRLEDLF